jgi:NAD(P)-dependent dehydrogenase (short-subunit alcohol dehydrogenase family)
MERKVVLITGCSSGIGKALSVSFHNSGYSVIATARRPEALDGLRTQGIVVEQLDVTDTENIRRVVHKTLEREKHIDVLVNNAGYGLILPLMDVTPEELERQFKTNVFGPVQIIREVAPSMRENKGGTIINIGSISGVVATPFAGSYCASKAAVHMISDSLRMELAPFGIRVVCMQPGGIQSNFGNVSSSVIQKTMPSNSWYASVRDHVNDRAMESQSHAMPAEKLARAVVKVAASGHPPAILRMGTRSLTLPLIRSLFPASLLDAIFVKRFGVNRIALKDSPLQ